MLYLREFTEDPVRARLAPAVRTALGGPGRSPLSEEEQLARAVRFIGPLIAVGRPGARLHHAGARCATMPADDRHGPVLRLTGKATLILMSTGGGGAGLRRELEQALTRVPRQRLLPLIPHGAEAYAQLSTELLREGWLTAPLPGYPPLSERRARVLPYRGAVGFGADGAARFVRFDPRGCGFRLLARRELHPEHGEHLRDHEGGGGALCDAGGDQHLRIDGEAGQCRGDGEGEQPELEDAEPAEPVAQAGCGDHAGGEGEHIAGDRPLQLGARRVQFAPQGG
ncbi:hypothetical protein OHA44_18760 [Streptomyces sp. NBC_00144]|nr:hypothetical protein OG221_18920 [Streptomyces sp. NBC_00932]